MAKRSFLALAVLIGGLGAGLLANLASAAPADCPTKLGEYVAGEATSDFVKHCMGEPGFENHNPDGRFVYIYDLDADTKAAFLFNLSGKLIRIRGYGRN